MIIIVDGTWQTRLAPVLGLTLDLHGPVSAPTDRPWRPPSTIDRAVALGMPCEDARSLDADGRLDAVLRIVDRARAKVEIGAQRCKIEAFRKAIAPPPPTGNRLARRTAKAEQRRARR